MPGRDYDRRVQQPDTGWRGRAVRLGRGGSATRLLLAGVPAIAAATGLVWLLEDRFGVLNASPVYLVAVVVTALIAGTAGGLAAAVAGTLVYDFLFVHPLHTLAISDPGEWLNLVLLLFVGLVVGQLTALERSRALQAEAREREARDLFGVSRALATRASTTAVLPEIAEQLREAAHLASAWIALGPDDAAERVAALAGDAPPPGTPLHWVLRRMPGDEPARWLRIHTGVAARTRGARDHRATYRVRIEAGGRSLGSIWATRADGGGHLDRSGTRLLSAAADQIGQALSQDRLAAEAGAAEVARQSDALKSALLQSVSHDLRTPLATIRAAAGSLRPDSDLDADGRAASAGAIEREVARLDRIVANLLDLGRIEAGALRADTDVFELDDIAGRTIDRMARRLEGRDLRIEVAPLPVLVDPVFLDEALTNLLDNAIKFGGPRAAIRIAAERAGDRVRLVVEDGGPGVADADLERVFEPFYRGASNGGDGRPGTGIGLAVVRGLVTAMGGATRASRGTLGGLAVELDLPLASLPAELVTPA
jgi:two-component system, OmpR family, sensor histidine kinase KdpD